MTTDRSHLYDAAAAHVDPSRNRQHMEEAVKQVKEEQDEQIKQDLETGLLTWSKLKPREQYQAFEEETLPEDKPLVLSPHYRELRDQGLAPKLLAETILEGRAQLEAQYQALQEQAMMMGQPSPPAPVLPEAPQFWPLILKVRPLVWERLTAEYRRLDKKHNEPAPR